MQGKHANNRGGGTQAHSQPVFRRIVRHNARRFAATAAILLVLTPIISVKTDDGKSTTNYKNIQNTQASQSASSTSPAVTQPAIGTQEDSNMNQSNESTNNASVTVNGQNIPVPANGSFQQSYASPDGQSQTNVSVSHTSSSSTNTDTGSSSTTMNVNVQTNSSNSINSSQGVNMP